MDAATQQTLGFWLFSIYVTLLVVGLASTLLRYRVFRHGPLGTPKLWYRDVVLLGGHAITIVMTMLARWAGLAANDLAANPVWWTLTSIPPIVAIGTYAYFELFVIGRDDR